MISFFRKIRQNLLTENKFSKYTLYAIGEIVLVVIGIYGWKKFYQNNNTFQELANSGNLALIKNESIKKIFRY